MGCVLVTGGAGFIGSHVIAALLAKGKNVRAFDLLSPQVHEAGQRPSYFPDGAELVQGDIRDRDAVARAFDGVDEVIHLASAVGVGQSMYELVEYTGTNDLGTAVLLEEIARRGVRKLVCASSMSIYGEGLFRMPDGDPVTVAERSLRQLRAGEWELATAAGLPLVPVATPEWKQPSLSSIYAVNKFAQERMCLIFGNAYRIPTVALRFFNVYGPHQALSNPYTGVLAIFAARLLNGRPPLVFEDGKQQRDFVHVSDVARACVLALESDAAGEAINIGSGEPRTILSIAETLAGVLGRPELRPHITGKARLGDIRHCYADISLARSKLGYEPQVGFEAGLRELAGWLAGQPAVDRVDEANAELEKKGLVA